MSDKKISDEKVFVSYLDDNDETRSGYFDVVEIEGSFVTIVSGKNKIILPYNRIKKIKRCLK